MPEKKDRRRKYAEGDKIVRLTISMPQSTYDQMIEDAGHLSASEYIRNLIIMETSSK